MILLPHVLFSSSVADTTPMVNIFYRARGASCETLCRGVGLVALTLPCWEPAAHFRRFGIRQVGSNELFRSAPLRIVIRDVNEKLPSSLRVLPNTASPLFSFVAQFCPCVEDAPCQLLCLLRAESRGVQNEPYLQLFLLRAAG